jgi:alpha-L-fucosidase
MESPGDYRCFEWFRDAKFGIRAHWGPQAVPMDGDWYYNRNWKVLPVSWVIHMLVDNVSRNGSLLLNVVQRPHGSLDPEVEQMLEQLATRNAIRGETIFGSRPWLVYGEGNVKVKGGSFSEDFKYNSKEIRFTTKGPTLYAIALGWPEDDRLLIRSLAKPQGANVNNIKYVSIPGIDGKPEWRQSAEGLLVTLPKDRISEFTVGVKITGTDLTNTPVEAVK